MKQNKYNLIIVLVLVVFSGILVFISHSITHEKVRVMKYEKYNNQVNSIKNQLKHLIDSKKDSTMTMALSLAEDVTLKKALMEKNSDLLKLQEFSFKLKNLTKFKNVWFQVIDKKGYSFYRSWSTKKGDHIAKNRIDIVNMIKDPKVISTISTGKFDMTFKSMVPIYQGDKFIGMFEIITHFNSVSRSLESNDIDSVFFVDKKYTKQLTKPFTNLFVDGYYVANLNAKQKLLDIMKKYGVKNYINNKTKFEIDNNINKLTTTYKIPDIHGNSMGYVVLFQSLDKIDMDDVKYIENNYIVYIVFSLLVLFAFGYYLSNRKYTSDLKNSLDEVEKQKEKVTTILDAQPTMIIVSDGGSIQEVNSIFLSFFKEFKTLDEFKSHHKSICEFFVDVEDDNSYLSNSEDWIELLLKNPKNSYKIAMKKDDILYHYIINAEKSKNNIIDDKLTIVTLIDITKEKEKDKLLFEQSKMASMGEMIGNIAHQWRQPLSVISTASTGMKMQKEFDALSDEQFYKNCDIINDNAQYLSKTISDFTNFIKGDSKAIRFDLKNDTDAFLKLIDSSIKTHHLNVVLDLTEDINLNGYPNELIQCFINIFNNAKDILVENNKENNRYIFISQKIIDNNIVIKFKDNGGGIPKDVLPQVFEPYFTTKHKAQGTGLGLHMTYNLIVDAMNGTIEATNEEFKYNDKQYIGACFTIKLPYKS
ncbi:MAG: ATP-binding protein [Campylobacterota bacterium]|nr:ATP-binding protein [Campylobacterota bacterium]